MRDGPWLYLGGVTPEAYGDLLWFLLSKLPNILYFLGDFVGSSVSRFFFLIGCSSYLCWLLLMLCLRLISFSRMTLDSKKVSAFILSIRLPFFWFSLSSWSIPIILLAEYRLGLLLLLIDFVIFKASTYFLTNLSVSSSSAISSISYYYSICLF